MTCKRSSLAILLTICATAALAADGRRPIAAHQVPFSITQSGSYVVTEDLTFAGLGNAILVDASHVTLDLNGHTVTATGFGDAIAQVATNRGLAVRNGAVLSVLGAGINAQGANVRIEQVTVAGWNSAAILTGPGAMLRDVSVGANASTNLAGLRAVETGDGSLLDGISVRGLATGGGTVKGVLAGDGSNLRNLAVQGNDSAGSWTAVEAGNGSVLTGIQVGDNEAAFSMTGIRIGRGGIVADSTSGAATSPLFTQGIDAGSASVLAGVSVSGVDIGIVLSNGSVLARSTMVQPGREALRAREGNVIRGNSIAGTADLGAGNLLAENILRGSVVTLDEGNYAVANHLMLGSSITAGDYNRIDRNLAPLGAGMVSAVGSNNFIVRNRAASFSVSGAANDHVAATLSGNNAMNANQPWANIDP